MPKSSMASRTPSAVQAGQDGRGQVDVVHGQALGDLQAELRRVDAGGREHLGHLDLEPGCWNWRAERFTPTSRRTPSVSCHVLASRQACSSTTAPDGQDGAVALGQLDELRRRQDAVLGVVPAHQGLGADDALVGQRDHAAGSAPPPRRARPRGAAPCRDRGGPGRPGLARAGPSSKKAHVPAPAALLGPVHGHVGLVEEVVTGRALPASLRAMPMLMVATTSWPPLKRTGSRRASTDPRRPPGRRPRARPSPSRTTTNSSPPNRDSVSPGRTARRSRSATTRSSSSPTWWPRLSLTTLKRSRSPKSTATRPRVRSAWSSAWSRWSSSRRRLASPVSGSWNAWRASWSSNALALGGVAEDDHRGRGIGVVRPPGDAVRLAGKCGAVGPLEPGVVARRRCAAAPWPAGPGRARTAASPAARSGRLSSGRVPAEHAAPAGFMKVISPALADGAHALADAAVMTARLSFCSLDLGVELGVGQRDRADRRQGVEQRAVGIVEGLGPAPSGHAEPELRSASSTGADSVLVVGVGRRDST